jgi:lysophospholipase L1-like esterase
MKTLLTALLTLALTTSVHAAEAKAKAKAKVEVINTGKGGNNTRHLLKRVDSVLAESKPDVVVLMVGTNDALNSRAMVPVDEYQNNLLTLIEKFRAAGAQPILMTILPCHVPYLIERHGEEAFAKESPEQRIAAINTVIHDFAAAEKIPLIDIHHIYTAIGEPGESETSLLRNEANARTRDGVHPTRDGYRIIATAVFQKIQSLENSPSRILCFGDSITFGAGMEGAGTATGDSYPGMLARLLE